VDPPKKKIDVGSWVNEKKDVEPRQEPVRFNSNKTGKDQYTTVGAGENKGQERVGLKATASY